MSIVDTTRLPFGSRAYSTGSANPTMSSVFARAITMPRIMMGLSTLAFMVSLYLAWSAYTMNPVAGCGQGSLFDCGHVLHSRWAKAAGVPVSVFALGTHAVLMASLLYGRGQTVYSRHRRYLIAFATFLAGGAALYFTGLQLFVIQHLCPYCLIAHACGLGLVIALLLWRPLPVKRLLTVAAFAVIPIVALGTVQAYGPTPVNYEVTEYGSVDAMPTLQAAPVGASGATENSGVESRAPASAPSDEPLQFDAPIQTSAVNVSRRFDAVEARIQEWLLFAMQPVGGLVTQTTAPASSKAAASDETTTSEPKTVKVLQRVELNPQHWPLLGDTNSPQVFVELFDYTCPHCAKTHQSLKAAKQRNASFAVLALPVPLDGNCNPTVSSTAAAHRGSCELSKLAIAVWLTDRTAFARFHDYLFAAKPSYQDALNQANQLVDAQELQKHLQSDVPNQYIAKHVQLYQQAGAGSVPKLLFPTATVSGAVESPQAIAELVRKHLRTN